MLTLRARDALPIVAATAVLLAGCTAPEPASPPSSEGTTGAEYSAWPVPSERIDAAVEALPGLVQGVMAQTGIPGVAVAVVHDGQTVYAGGFGVRSVDTGEPVDEHTVFQIASVSKSVGATVVAAEVTAGTVDWDDPVAPLLPGFELADPYVTEHVTLADLYSHRSGLPDFAGDSLEDLGFSREQILQRLRYLPLTPFRAEEHYTNFGLTAAAQAAANAAGMNWEDLSRERLYAPLGMDRTTSSHEEFTQWDNTAALHVRVDGEWMQLHERDPQQQSPAGGVASSASDLATWMRMLLAGGELDGTRIIDPDVLLRTLAPSAPHAHLGSLTSRPENTALGFNVKVLSTGLVQLSHSGAFALGGSTNFQVIPALGLGIVVLTNGAPIGVPEGIASDFLDLAIVGELTRDWVADTGGLLEVLLGNTIAVEGEPPAGAAPAAPLGDYLGVYANDYYGPAEIVLRGDELVLRVGLLGEYPLEHWDGDAFAWVWPGESSPGRSLLHFDLTAGTLTVEALDAPAGIGVFRR